MNTTIGLFYYTLGNILPQYRSQLKAIQLLAVAKRPVIKKYGINCMLQTFMEEIAELEQVHKIPGIKNMCFYDKRHWNKLSGARQSKYY